jgi:peptidoglycan/xylan/chitin deacetylase (PgdA/CDA1 family)
VVNLEVWPFDQPMPRKLISRPHGGDAIPDVPNYSWVEYGMRAGLPRIFSYLAEEGIRASASLNALVLEAYPGLGERIVDSGWEFVAHGYTQRALTAEASEESVIGVALDSISEFVGKRPRGWLGPGVQETFSTPDVLTRLGVEYTLDWSIADLPLWMRTVNGPLLAIPYTQELNDSVLWAAHQYPSDELYRRAVSTLETFDEELQHEPRILTLALHPHLVAVPHRWPYLKAIVKLLRSRDDVDFVTGSDIFDWFSREVAPDGE